LRGLPALEHGLDHHDPALFSIALSRARDGIERLAHDDARDAVGRNRPARLARLDGSLYRGARYGAGEVGHMPVVGNGRACVCGLRGCLEAYTGGAALAARMRAEIAAGARTSILERAGGDPAQISAEHWVAALRAGEPYAKGLAEEYLDVLSQALAILILALDLDRIALGTIVARNPDLFLEPLRERVAARVWPRLRDTKLVPIELGARLSAYAGLVTALLELESPTPSSA
jgi:glucokinase